MPYFFFRRQYSNQAIEHRFCGQNQQGQKDDGDEGNPRVGRPQVIPPHPKCACPLSGPRSRGAAAKQIFHKYCTTDKNAENPQMRHQNERLDEIPNQDYKQLRNQKRPNVMGDEPPCAGAECP